MGRSSYVSYAEGKRRREQKKKNKGAEGSGGVFILLILCAIPICWYVVSFDSGSGIQEKTGRRGYYEASR